MGHKLDLRFLMHCQTTLNVERSLTTLARKKTTKNLNLSLDFTCVVELLSAFEGRSPTPSLKKIDKNPSLSLSLIWDLSFNSGLSCIAKIFSTPRVV
jgi:hypothetical protein